MTATGDSGARIERRKVRELSFDPANARQHGARNIDAIKKSLLRFGQQKPIVINARNIVIAGNGTLRAAQDLGWTEIDCVVTTLEGAEARAFALADNRTSELAEWDDAALNAVLQSLEADKSLLDATGFLERDVQRLLKQELTAELESDAEPAADESVGEAPAAKRVACPRCGERFEL